MRRFPGVGFSPLALRALLRERLGRGEDVIAWGVGQAPVTLSLAVLRIGLAILPGFGQVLAAISTAAFSPSPFLLVLTDRRLLTIRPAGRRRTPLCVGPLADVDLGELRVVADSPPTFELQRLMTLPGGARGEEASATLAGVMRVTIQDHKTRPTGRLIEALALLAEPRAPEGRGGGAGAAGGAKVGLAFGTASLFARSS